MSYPQDKLKKFKEAYEKTKEVSDKAFDQIIFPGSGKLLDEETKKRIIQGLTNIFKHAGVKEYEFGEVIENGGEVSVDIKFRMPDGKETAILFDKKRLPD